MSLLTAYYVAKLYTSLTLIGPYQYLVRIVCYHLEGLGEHHQNRAFFCQNWSYFPMCARKGHTYFAKMSKILIRESDIQKEVEK
jgi:hypothetical protein